jgi:hypothetical protein
VQAALALWGFGHDAARRDFGHFVSSASTWRATGSLYENVARVNLNPPHASVLLFTPLTWIPFDAAVALWVALQIATLAWTVALIARELNLPPQRLEWVVPATVGSTMTIHNWIEGQVGGVLLIGGAVAWRAARQNKKTAASIILGSLVNLKPQLGLILLAFDRALERRVIVISAVMVTASVVLTGPALWLSWIAATRAQGLQLLPWNVSIAPLLYRSGATASMPYLYAALAAVIVGVTWRATRGDMDGDRRWLLWGIAMLLVAPVSWVYYAASFLGPLISWGERHRWPLPARLGVFLWLVPLQMLSWVGSSQPSWRLGIVGSVYTWGATLVWLSALSSRVDHER